jgi:hypothetical protein
LGSAEGRDVALGPLGERAAPAASRYWVSDDSSEVHAPVDSGRSDRGARWALSTGACTSDESSRGGGCAVRGVAAVQRVSDGEAGWEGVRGLPSAGRAAEGREADIHRASEVVAGIGKDEGGDGGCGGTGRMLV